MKVQSISAHHSSPAVARRLAKASLRVLLEQIVRRGDREALREFHDHRTPFRLGGYDHPMALTPYVTCLCESAWAQRLCGHDRQVAERALDLAIDRFSAIPAADDGPHGPDCRLYFASVLQAVRDWIPHPEDVNALEVETITACILQRRVTMHTWLCCKEALRMRRSVRTRYIGRTATGDIPLWLPATLPSHRRRSWLAANVPDPDASRDRVTQLVRPL